MKKIGFLSLLLASSLLFVGCDFNTENEVIDDCIIPEECADENGVEEFTAYYDNGNIKMRGNYVNGMKEGVWTEYDEGGNVINLEEYHEGVLVEDEEETYDFANDENLLNLYPEIKDNFSGEVILGDTLQTNYISGAPVIYYDPYEGIALKLGEEFDGGLIREIDTDEGGYPLHEMIFLVKGEDNEENRTGINGYREVFAISAISKQTIENFKVTPDFNDKIIGENNAFYFISEQDNSHYSSLVVFDIEDNI